MVMLLSMCLCVGDGLFIWFALCLVCWFGSMVLVVVVIACRIGSLSK